MYTKLILRGLLRHKTSGKRMFVLIALCSLAILFCLGFRDSFSRRYRELGVDVSTAHLQILPSDSPKLRQSSFSDHRQGLSLFEYPEDLRDFLSGLPEVDGAMPVIETGAALFGVDGESTGFTPSLIGVDPAMLKRILPGARIIEGKDALKWAGGESEVPLFRPSYDWFWAEKADPPYFERSDFRFKGSDWEAWKRQVVQDYPRLFPGRDARDFAGENGDTSFLKAMTAVLGRDDLTSIAVPSDSSAYDWRLDDAIAALDELQGQKASAGDMETRLAIRRKMLLQALFPDVIRPVREGITLDTPYTMAVPPARGDDLLGQPEVIPVRMTAFVEKLPLYFFNFYVDKAVLHNYLSIPEDQCTSVFIRLKSASDVRPVKAAIAAWLAERKPDCVVRDSEELGKMFLATATAFEVITLIVLLLFVATVIVFVVNSVMLALIKRRREIGTSIALGLSPSQNAWVILGEMGALVTVSWLCAAVVGTGIELAFASFGMPGLVFFPGNRLYFAYSPIHAAQSFLIVILAALGASAFALRKMGDAKVVQLLKEAA